MHHFRHLKVHLLERISTEYCDSSFIAERGQTFRWSAFLRSYPPPGRIVQDNGSLSSSGLQSSNALLKNDSLEPGLLRAARLSSSDSSDFRDFAEPNANVTHGRSPGLFEALEIPLPTLSTEGPSRSILVSFLKIKFIINASVSEMLKFYLK